MDELDVLGDHMFGNLGGQVDEVHVLVEPVEGFDPMVVFQVAIHRGLTVVGLSGHIGRVLPLKNHLLDNGGFVGNTGTHFVESACVR